MDELAKWSGRALGFVVLIGFCMAAGATDWLPISTEELQLTSEVKAPKAPAIMLYRQVDRDDIGPVESVYIRIKILTEEGRQFADVALPFNKLTERIYAIEARTIHPDGGICKFDGTVYDTTIAKSRDELLIQKTFTLADVSVGSIIEYRYKHQLGFGYVFNSHWILSDSLFTRHAKFSLIPYPGFGLRYSWPMGLPEGTQPPASVHGRFELDARDVPAFVSEEYSPPENDLKYRVDFVYVESFAADAKDPVDFWRRVGKRLNSEVESFVDKPTAMQKAVAQIVAAGDDAESKLHKIYDRVQQLRNTSFEHARTEQELQRNPEKDARNVAEVWEHGYGTGTQLTWLFMALARAAGIPAQGVMVPSRDQTFFEPGLMNANQLDTNIVRIQLDGKDLFLDPGTLFAPFGALPWTETAVRCRLLDKEGGTWIDSPLPAATESRVERQAVFALSATGDLEGTVTVTYSGLEALWRRIHERNEDDAARKSMLEAEIKAAINAGSEVALTNEPKWERSEENLVAEFSVHVPGWAAMAGHRRVMSVGLFGGARCVAASSPTRRSRTSPLKFPSASSVSLAVRRVPLLSAASCGNCSKSPPASVTSRPKFACSGPLSDPKGVRPSVSSPPTSAIQSS